MEDEKKDSLFACHADIFQILRCETTWRPGSSLKIPLNVALDVTVVDTTVPSLHGDPKDLRRMRGVRPGGRMVDSRGGADSEDASNVANERGEDAAGEGDTDRSEGAGVWEEEIADPADEWHQSCNLVVLDNLFDEPLRASIYEYLTDARLREDLPPSAYPAKWERLTSDGVGLPLSWGVTDALLDGLAAQPAVREVLARVAALYPDHHLALQPAQEVFAPRDAAAGAAGAGAAAGVTIAGVGAAEAGAAKGERAVGSAVPAVPGATVAPRSGATTADGDAGASTASATHSAYATHNCAQFVANAPVCGDSFDWHHDADPCSFPADCEWVRRFGSYLNHTPGKPLFFTLLLYLNSHWRRNWYVEGPSPHSLSVLPVAPSLLLHTTHFHPSLRLFSIPSPAPPHRDAETLFLDPDSATGVFVRPMPYRAVLMDMDMTHRVSAPSALCGGRPRYSLAIKVGLGLARHVACCLATLFFVCDSCISYLRSAPGSPPS